MKLSSLNKEFFLSYTFVYDLSSSFYMNKNELITVCDDFDKINPEFNKFFC